MQAYSSIFAHLNRDYLKRKTKMRENPPAEPKLVTTMFDDAEVESYSEQLVKSVLSHCNGKVKHDVIGLLGTLIDDLSELSNETYFNMVSTIRQSDVSFSFTDLDTFDPFLSQIIIESVDYMLVYKRDFIKGLQTF